MFIELVEAALPQTSLGIEPSRGLLESFRLQAVGTNSAALVRGHETKGLQHLQMLMKGWQRHLEIGSELACRRRGPAQVLNDLAPRRVGKCLEHLRDITMQFRGGRLIRHLPNIGANIT